MSRVAAEWYETHATVGELELFLGARWAICPDTKRNRERYGRCITREQYEQAEQEALKWRQHYYIITAHPGDQIVAPGPDKRFTSLYDAAGWMHEHARNWKPNRKIPFDIPPCVHHSNTGERWSYEELFDGGFMDDYLSRKELAQRCRRSA